MVVIEGNFAAGSDEQMQYEDSSNVDALVDGVEYGRDFIANADQDGFNGYAQAILETESGIDELASLMMNLEANAIDPDNDESTYKFYKMMANIFSDEQMAAFDHAVAEHEYENQTEFAEAA